MFLALEPILHISSSTQDWLNRLVSQHNYMVNVYLLFAFVMYTTHYENMYFYLPEITCKLLICHQIISNFETKFLLSVTTLNYLCDISSKLIIFFATWNRFSWLELSTVNHIVQLLWNWIWWCTWMSSLTWYLRWRHWGLDMREWKSGDFFTHPVY